MTRLSAKISQDLKAKLEKEAAKEDISLSKYLRENLPSLVKQNKVSVPMQGNGQQQPMIPSHESNIGSRMKGIIADAMETKMYLKVLGIDLGEKETQSNDMSQWIPMLMGGQMGNRQQPQKEEMSPKDMMNQVAMIQMINNMNQDKGMNPETTRILEELKNASTKTREQLGRSNKEDMDLEDLMKWMAILKMTGQPEEAKEVQDMFNKRMAEMQKEMYNTRLEMQKQEGTFQRQLLEKKLNEVKNAPSAFDRITYMSRLAEKDPAVKKYLHTKLGIEEKEQLTPNKLGKYIENIKVPLGQIIKGVGSVLQRGKGGEMPAPPSPQQGQPTPQPTPEKPEESGNLENQHLPPEKPSSTPKNKKGGTYPSEPMTQPEPEPELTGKQKARGMLSQDVPLDKISSETGLSSPQIRGLKGAMVRAGELEKKE